MISKALIALMATVCLCAQVEATHLNAAELARAATLVDPSSLLASSVEDPKDGDIQEDPRDRFITSRSGKRRPMLSSDSEASEWADDVPVAKFRKLTDVVDGTTSGSIAGGVLSRKKRCNNNTDDDTDARRSARRARRARARRARRARKAAATKVQTTTVTRKVINQNGQVVSETTYAQPPVGQQQVLVAPATGPVVQSIAPVQQQQQQPMIIQQQPAPVVQAAPQAVQQQQAAGLPSISVQGSVKVN